ncbi:MAG TPA: SprT family zinc-dependent metalloprotease, partial [Vicinamibacterales bacterium]|nr:SprT family zinc-dependent metalloprotease [Vicinamibacterales bacterium]
MRRTGSRADGPPHGAQLRLPFGRSARETTRGAVVSVPGVGAGVVFVRHRRARQYVLRLRDDGSVRVTLPWRGSRAEAQRFVRERRDWILRQRLQHAASAAARSGPWLPGTSVLLRGVEEPIRVQPAGGALAVTLGSERLVLPASACHNLRPPLEAHLRSVAARELRGRLHELARAHGFTVAAVSIRAQRTRWGSCSRSGRISLNWRLIQVPASVRDYVLLHELAHLKHADHSARFHREVERLCPHCAEARRWLRETTL